MADDNSKNERIKTVLVVEDEALMAKLLSDRLSSQDMEVYRAEDGEEGLEKMKEHRPDLVILDVLLPKLSGFQVMEKAAQDPEITDIPILVVSNLGLEENMEKGEELGAIGYFVKANMPVGHLVKDIKKILEGEIPTSSGMLK